MKAESILWIFPFLGVSLLDNGVFEFLEAIRTACVRAVESRAPTGVYIGTVSCASPLQIMIDQRLSLSKEHLVLCSSVKDFDKSVLIGGESTSLKIPLALEEGEEVVLLRAQGGQKYIVLDRL